MFVICLPHPNRENLLIAVSDGLQRQRETSRTFRIFFSRNRVEGVWRSSSDPVSVADSATHHHQW